MTLGEGINNLENWSNVIYGWPLRKGRRCSIIKKIPWKKWVSFSSLLTYALVFQEYPLGRTYLSGRRKKKKKIRSIFEQEKIGSNIVQAAAAARGGIPQRRTEPFRIYTLSCLILMTDSLYFSPTQFNLQIHKSNERNAINFNSPRAPCNEKQ